MAHAEADDVADVGGDPDVGAAVGARSEVPDAVGGPRTRGGRNLPLAIISGILLAGMFVGSVLWHPLAFTAVVALLVVLAVVEAGLVLRPLGLRVEVPVLLVSGAVLLGGTYLARGTGQVVGIASMFVGAVVWLLTDPRRRDIVRTLGATMMLGLWVPFLASYAVLLITRPDDPAAAVFAVAGGAAASDVGAYAIGSRFGRHKIAPSISPNKSWEGLIGGLASAAALAALILPRVGDLFDPASAAAVAALCGLAGFVGDLTESMIKRDLGLKDLGRIVPGHGGILDRVDGILFALPVGWYAIELFT